MIRHPEALLGALALLLLVFSAAPSTLAAPRRTLGGAAGPQAPGLYLYNLRSGNWTLVMPADSAGGFPAYVWSPDGSKLAVASSDPGSGNGLQVVDLSAGRTSLVLPATAGTANRLTWSPDSSRLAFIFAAAPGSSSNVTSALRVWSAADGRVRTLIPNLASLPAWTPDGNGITVSILDPSLDLESNNNQIVTIDATSGSTIQTVVTGPAAVCQIGLAWSPNGAYLAYAGTGFHEGCLPGTGGVYTWNATTGATTQLTGSTAEAPIWLPDGSILDAVASGTNPSGPATIAIVRFQPDGSGQQTLADGLPNDFPPPRPRFQAAAGEIIYATMNCSGADVWALDPGASQPRKLNASARYAIGAHLSPDGMTVAWTGAGAGANALTLAPTNGATPTTVLNGALGIMPGDFSPDGRWLIFGNTADPLDPCAGI